MDVSVGRRLAKLERSIERLQPRPRDAWLSWVSLEDLEWLEYILSGGEPAEADAPRIIAIEADATRRIMLGEPRA
jgi:hypothetical protein